MTVAKARAGAWRPLAAVLALSAAALCATTARADPFRWPQPGGPGSAVVLTYTFSNLLDAPFLGSITPDDLRRAAAEASGLWGRYAPLEFFELNDSGPCPSDAQYEAAGFPQLRIGVHAIDDPNILAHAFLPRETEAGGIVGDVHLNALTPFAWSLGGGFPTVDVLEVLTHEIGHALGLEHIPYADAIMGAFHGYRFHGLGTGYLLA